MNVLATHVQIIIYKDIYQISEYIFPSIYTDTSRFIHKIKMLKQL